MSKAPQAVVVMGVCGCGKSTVGERLARELGALFIEGDAFHPPPTWRAWPPASR